MVTLISIILKTKRVQMDTFFQPGYPPPPRIVRCAIASKRTKDFSWWAQPTSTWPSSLSSLSSSLSFLSTSLSSSSSIITVVVVKCFLKSTIITIVKSQDHLKTCDDEVWAILPSEPAPSLRARKESRSVRLEPSGEVVAILFHFGYISCHPKTIYHIKLYLGDILL